MPSRLLLSRPRQRLARIALACSLFASAAHANSYDVGVVPLFPATYDMLVAHAPGSFIDHFNFALVQGANLSTSAVGVDLSFTSGASYHINSLSVAIYDTANTFYGIALGSGSPQQAAIESLLGPGNYYAEVSGITDGSAGGKYSYTISAIPEADRWVMFALGIVAVFLARRRTRKM